MNKITEELLRAVSDFKEALKARLISGKTAAVPAVSPPKISRLHRKRICPVLIFTLLPVQKGRQSISLLA